MLNTDKVLQTHNTMVESQVKAMTENCTNAIQALNKVANQSGPPPSQFKVGEQVWLDATHLKLPHQKAKLTPKCLGPFKVTQKISPVAYCLKLPTNWRIHNMFHALLFTPYHKMYAHGPNFTHPPPDLIDGEDEYEVKQIVTHRQFRRSKKLQYLTKWKGYPESDNTWEPTDQVHTPLIVKHYQSTAKHQSARKSAHQSAILHVHIKTPQGIPKDLIKCPVIFPASPSNVCQKTSLSKNLPHSNDPNSTSTPPSHNLSVTSISVTRSAPRTPLTIAASASLTTAPTTTRLCQTTLPMS